MNISHFFELLLHLILIAFTRHFKGQMKILTSMLYHKSHYPESHYQLRISNGIGTAKILFFSYKFFLEKKTGHLYPIQLNIFFLLFSYSASISLWCNYLFLCNVLLIYSEASFGVLEKRMFEFSKATVHYRFEKIRKPIGKSFGNFSVKHPYWRPF